MKKLLCLCFVAVFAPAMAQVAPTMLYAPARSIKDQKISLQGWGSGTIVENDQVAFQGTTSLRVSSRNFFQGGTMTLGDPKDLAKKYDDKANLLQFTFFLEDAGWVYGVNDRSGGKFGNESVKHAGPGAGGAIQEHSGGGSTEKFEHAVPFKPKIKEVRLIVTTTDDKKSEIYVPIKSSQTMGNEWRRIAVPLQAISGFDRTNKIVKDISISSDTFATIYVGSIGVITDQTPITGSIQNLTSLNLALGDEVPLTADGDGGTSVLVYSWDFDDRDGIQVDAEGQSVKHKFRKAGKFKVTLTISDLYGLKKPYVTSFPVTVNP